MIRALTLLVFLVASAACAAQTTASDTTFRILTYGLPRFEYQNATWVVGQKWGIQHRSVAGCIVTHELVDSVKKENDRVMASIVVRFGADWEKRFDADVQQEFERQKEVVSKIRELPSIQAKEAEMKAEGNGLHYWVIPALDGDEVRLQGYGQWEGATEWLVLYTFKVDSKSGTPILISDTPWKE